MLAREAGHKGVVNDNSAPSTWGPKEPPGTAHTVVPGTRVNEGMDVHAVLKGMGLGLLTNCRGPRPLKDAGRGKGPEAGEGDGGCRVRRPRRRGRSDAGTVGGRQRSVLRHISALDVPENPCLRDFGGANEQARHMGMGCGGHEDSRCAMPPPAPPPGAVSPLPCGTGHVHSLPHHVRWQP